MGLTSNGSVNLPLAPASAPEVSIQIDSAFLPGGGLYDQSISGIQVDGKKRTLSVVTYRLAPRQTARNFLTSLTYKKPWQALRVDNIEATDLPMDSLLTGGGVNIPDITIGDLNLDVYENPNLKPGPDEKQKPFPVEIFRSIGYPVMLQSITVARADIAYGVLKEGSDEPDITFEGEIVAENISSYQQDNPAEVSFDFTFDGTSPANVTFTLDQAGDGRNFHVVGELSDYDLTEVNPLLVVAANADIESGYVSHMNHDIAYNGTISEGDMTLKYENLDIRMEGNGAWIANLLEGIAVRNSNPRDDGDLEVGQIELEHDTNRSFFNLYWKSLLMGMKSSALGNVLTPDKLESE
jgi:hypothetical protein